MTTQAPIAPTFRREDISRERDRKYPAQLVVNETKKKDTGDPDLIRYNWHQEWKTPGRVFPDGNPGSRHNTAFLGDANPQGQIVQAAYANSLADQLADAFLNTCGIDMLPDNPDSALYDGHWFMVEDVNVNKDRKDADGNARKGYYVAFPVEYLGQDYTYTGPVTVIPVSDRSEVEEEKAPDIDPDALARVSTLIAGLDPAAKDFAPTALRAINGDEVLGKNATLVLPTGETLRGSAAVRGPDGLPVLVTALLSAGFISLDENNLIQVVGD